MKERLRTFAAARRLPLAVGALVVAAVLSGIVSVAAWEAATGDDGQTSRTPLSTAAAPRATADEALSIAEIYEQAAPGVVEVRVGQTSEDDQGFGLPQPGSRGSGFVIDEEGHIVTNHHVVDTADRVTIVFSDGDEAEARVVGTDPSTDIALLQLEDVPDDLTPLELGSAESLEIGDPVVAIGSPFGLQGSVTSGIVSGLDRQIRAPNGFTIDGAIQTDAALNRGNSGGPLLDAAGRVMGVASQIESDDGSNAGVGYAVPSDTARDVVDQLRDTGEVEHAYLGVQIGESDEGAEITEVVESGPADDAGLRVGDIVVRAGGGEIDSADQLREAVDERDPGDTLELELRRGGGTRTIEVELGVRPDQAQ